jgi:predicted ATPase/class 3 adenylate cyclase
MAEFPSGTVTFVFTDIEGSTRLLARLRGRYAGVLAQHQRVLRAAFDAFGGREVHTEGDAFFVAFARASDAIAAAVSAQRALASQHWPEGVEVRVRMGVHTGEAHVQLDDYVGLEVHRAARICAVGHGGQVLISGSTRELVADELPQDVALRDLGEHRLKDLDRPQHLFQVVAGDLPADFPLLGSMSPGSRGANGLPPSPNRTIGRDHDVRAIADRLRDGDVRLLTLTGPGGVGKTRLALEAARAVRPEFADGARFISLAAVRRPDDVPSAIIQSLTILPLSGESPEQAVTRFLSGKELLLVLDNLEHLLPAGRFVWDLLVACSALTVLATSRQALALHAEERYPVAPLALPELGIPEDTDALAGVAAVALFTERARARDPRFDLGDDSAPAVAEICRRVDGLPLAIELAAARCGLLSAGEIAERLDATLSALSTGAREAPARQRTLRATIDWSYDLLGEKEQACFVRFAVFAGGASLEAAEAIIPADLDTLENLVAKSLLVRPHGAGGPTRLVMLETIRADAAQRLAAAADADADADDVRERHCRFFLALAQRHGGERALGSARGREHFARLDAEVENFDAALGWAIGRPDPTSALAMAGALGDYWLERNRFAYAVNWYDRTLQLAGANAQPKLRVRLLLDKARCLWPLGRGAEEASIVETAAAIARGLGDPVIISRTLQALAHLDTRADRLDAASALADEALQWAIRAGDDWEIARAHWEKALAAPTIADVRQLTELAATQLQEVGNVARLVSLLSSAAYAALCESSDHDAKAFLSRAEPIARAREDRYALMLIRGNAGLASLFSGEADAAREAFREELELCRELVVPPVAHEALRGLAGVAVVDGDIGRAARLLGAATAHRFGDPEDRVDTRLHATFFDPVRRDPSSVAWDAPFHEGTALSFDDAIAYALQEPPA